MSSVRWNLISLGYEFQGCMVNYKEKEERRPNGPNEPRGVRPN
jgi:hypothetical protein